MNKSPYGPEILHRGGAQLQAAMSAGGVRGALPSISSPAARQALLDAYQVGFSATLNHLMDIGAVVAFVGAVCGFALVRQGDFVVPTAAPAAGPPEQELAPALTGRARTTPASPPSMLEPFTLEGTDVRLEPLSEDHIPGLWWRRRPRTARTTSGPTPPRGWTR